jgi:uncharacterized phage protein gp47/JayE
MPLSLSFNEISNNMRVTLNALSKRLADDNVGSANRTIIEAVAGQMEEILYYFDQQIAKLFLTTAEGTDLDVLAYDRYQLVRKPPKVSKTYVTVGKDTSQMTDSIGLRIPIPVGTVFSTDPDAITGQSVSFVTTESASILVTGHGVDTTTNDLGNPVGIPVECTTPGTFGNVQVGKIVNITSSVNLDTVTNPQSATGGKTEQTDEDFRKDIILFLLTLARGTKLALKYAALKSNLVTSASVVESGFIPGKLYYFIDSDSGRVIQYPHQIGQLTAGKVAVYVDNGGATPTYDMMVAILQDIESYRAAGTLVLLAAPDVKQIDCTLQVIIDNNADADLTRTAISQNVTNFFANLELGQKLYINQLISAVLQVQAVRNVTVISPSADDLNVGLGQVVRLRTLSLTQVEVV